MKQVLIINADIDKSPVTAALIQAYTKGVEEGGGTGKEIAIADMIFNSNKQFSTQLQPLEPSLEKAILAIKACNHFVVFCPVYKNSINAKIKGFFDRIFLPDLVFTPVGSVNNNFGGKSARIISILDEEAWEDWNLNQKPTYLAIKKSVLEKRSVRPVNTSTIGHLHSLENNYSKKWLQKLFTFGLKGI